MKELVALILIASIASTLLLSGCVSDEEDTSCVEAEDCEGLLHIECYGEWTCVEGECAYVCAMMPEGNESGSGGG